MAQERVGLETELEFFEQNRKEWARTHPGEYVVIRGNELDDFYPDYETALRRALKRFGVESQFLVKQVWAEEPVFYIY